MEGKRIILFLERCHWESTLFVNGKKAGRKNSLATPHEYDITDFLVRGKNRISIRMDNRVIVPVGVNSHSISDHTQSNWNGITGDISLKATSKVFIREVRIYPDIKGEKAKVIVTISNKTGIPFKGKVALQAESFNSDISQNLKRYNCEDNSSSDDLQLMIDYPMGKKMQLWSELSPSLYKLSVNLTAENGQIIDDVTEDFGMREFKTNGTQFSSKRDSSFSQRND